MGLPRIHHLRRSFRTQWPAGVVHHSKHRFAHSETIQLRTRRRGPRFASPEGMEKESELRQTDKTVGSHLWDLRRADRGCRCQYRSFHCCRLPAMVKMIYFVLDITDCQNQETTTITLINTISFCVLMTWTSNFEQHHRILHADFVQDCHREGLAFSTDSSIRSPSRSSQMTT